MTDYQQLKADQNAAAAGSFFKKANAAPVQSSGGPGSDVSPAEKKKTLIALLLALGIL